MKILHFADPHLDETTLPNSDRALDQILAVARHERPDFIVNCGDIAMRRGWIAPWVARRLRAFHDDLAVIARVAVLEGNHDMTYDGRAGAIRGALEFSGAGSPRLLLFDRPSIAHVIPGLTVAAMPYPSRARLRAKGVVGSTGNERVAELMLQTIRGLGALARAETPDDRLLLLYHGSILGAVPSTETTMTTEMDPLLDEALVPAEFEAILCGHIHKHQKIGRAVYAGSPAPLNFAEDRHEHGVVLWESTAPGSDTRWVHRFVPLEPAERLLTFDMRDATGDRRTRLPGLHDPTACRVRVLVRVGRNEDGDRIRDELEAAIMGRGASEVRILMERVADDPAMEIAGEAIAPEASMDALLDLWAGRVPEARPILEGLKAYAASVDADLSPEARRTDRVAEYRLRVLRCSNWKSLSAGPHELNLETLGRLVAIEGDNASGKSNLMEAEAFALWGRTLRGRQSLADLVRKGTAEAWAEVEVEAAGERWKVRRSLKVNSKGVGSAFLSLARRVPWLPVVSEEVRAAVMGSGHDARWEPADKGTARETDAFLETLVGPFDLYLDTRCASQGDVDRIVAKTPAELKATVQAALNSGIFVERERIARERLTQAQAEEHRVSGRLEILREKAAGLEGDGAQVELSRNDLVAANATLETAIAQTAWARNAHREASEALAVRDAAAAAHAKALEDAARATRAVQGKREVIDELGRRVCLGDAAAIEARRRPALQAELDALAGALALRADRAKRLKALEAESARTFAAARDFRVERSRKRDDAHSVLARTRRAEARAHDEVVEIAARSRRAVDELALALGHSMSRARDAASGIDLAPFGEKCAEARCPMLDVVVKARAELPDMEARHAEKIAAAEASWAETVTAGVDRIRRVAEEVAGYSAALEALEAPLIEEDAEWKRLHESATAAAAAVMDARAAAEPDGTEPRASEIRSELARIDGPEVAGKATAGLAARSAMETATVELEVLKADAATASAAVPETPPDAAQARRLVVIGRAAIDAAENVEEAKRTDRDRALRALAAAEARLEASAEAAGDLEAAEFDRGVAIEVAATIALYARAVGKDGLPYLMLERSVPALERHANRFLGSDVGDTDLRLEIEPMRDMQSGDTKAEVVVRYRNKFGLHALPAASGFERVALGYALRAALARVQAEAHGIHVRHFIADEGWGAFDEKNLPLGQRMLMRMADDFEQVLFVSHVGTIREIAESRVRIIPDAESGSGVEVEA